MKMSSLAIIAGLSLSSVFFNQIKAEEPPPNPQAAPTTPPRESKPAANQSVKTNKAQKGVLHGALNKLTPEERQKTLKALRTIWQDAEVAKHRSDFQQSREKYLSALVEAASDLDPEVEKLLKPMLGSIINSQSLDQLIPGNPQFGQYLRAIRITPEQIDKLSEAERERLNAVAPRVLADSRFKIAADEAKKMSPGPERREAAKRLVHLARTLTSEIDPELKSLMDSPIVPPRRLARRSPGGPARPGEGPVDGKKDPVAPTAPPQ